MLKRVKLSSLKPNPWRHFETYKIVPEKVDTLKESIASTGFWKGQITARPAAAGGYEIAWGHHRWIAAKKVLGDGAFVEIIVDDLTDDDMLTRMARENNEVYDANASMDIEVVKAALEGHVQGKIHLPKIDGAKRQSNPCDYVDCEKSCSATFSQDALVKHLGMKLWRVKTALENLKLIHENMVDVSDYEDLSPRQAQEVAAETRRAKAATNSTASAKKVAKAVSSTMRVSTKGKAKNDPERGGYRQAKAKAAEVISEEKGENQDIKRFIREIDSTASKLKTAATKLRELNNMLVMAKVEQFTGPQAADLREAMRRVQESCRMFDMEWPAKLQPKIKLVK